jgi:hypothetical protein
MCTLVEKTNIIQSFFLVGCNGDGIRPSLNWIGSKFFYENDFKRKI